MTIAMLSDNIQRPKNWAFPIMIQPLSEPIFDQVIKETKNYFLIAFSTWLLQAFHLLNAQLETLISITIIHLSPF